jgi:hypothetical protein
MRHDEPSSQTGFSGEDIAALRAALPDAPVSARLRSRILADMQQMAERAAPRASLWQQIGGWRLLGPSLAFGLMLGVSVHQLAEVPMEEWSLDSEEEWDLLQAAQLEPGWEDEAP